VGRRNLKRRNRLDSGHRAGRSSVSSKNWKKPRVMEMQSGRE
jgi:hypothetical protein